MLELIYNKINVPLIIHGGAGNQNHIYEVLKLEKISGVAISSLLHYSFIKGKKFKVDDFDEGNTQFLKSFNDKKILKKIIFYQLKNF